MKVEVLWEMIAFVRENEEVYPKKQVDQDGLWKKVIGELFEEFLQFFIPELYQEVDFETEPEFLDKELYQEVIDEKKGRRYADRLVKVHLKSGQEKWILIHVEIQGSREDEFPKRMFQYFYRIHDRHREEIVAVAVHTFPGTITNMQRFEYDYFGTRLNYSYNNYRTEDYLNAELERSDNIFSKVVLAAKAVHETKNEVEKRYRFKRKLMRDLLHSKKYSRMTIAATLYFIDYLLQLPDEEMKELSIELGPEIRKERGLLELYNEKNASPTVYNSFAEQLDRGIEQGIEQGIEKGIEQGLEKGIEQGIKNVAKKMIVKGKSDEEIMSFTDLSLEEINALRTEA